MRWNTTTRTAAAVLFSFVALGLSLSAQQASSSGPLLVASALNQQLAKIFPEIATGYIDFNGNGKPDVAGDLSETIPESRVKDGQLQAQEILDCVVANWRLISLDKLRAVREAVRSSPGAITELIAIDFSSSLDDAVAQREAMGDLLYLTPAAYKEAMSRMGGIITAMASAYKKEGSKAEADFVASRDALFQMIEKGYPLPQDIPAEERATLSTSMVSSILKERTANPGKTRTAIKTLGQLKSAETASYLLTLVDGSDYQVEAIRALGDIGYKPALPVLAKQLRSSKDAEVRRASLQALGAIGGSEGLDAILDLLKPANKPGLTRDLVQVEAQALSGIAQKGNADPRIQAALKDLSTSDDAVVRKAAATGLGAFATPASSDALLLVLANDKDPLVRAQAVVSLNKQKGDTIVPAFLKVLREKDLDPGLEVATLAALGENPGGSAALSLIVDNLADKNPKVRAAASTALLKLYPANQQLVTTSITRGLLASQDANFVVEGAALLAALADPTTLPALLTLLQNPQPEVKRNVTWALYKIRSSANPKVIDELQKLITNENETLEVRANAIRAVGAIGFDSPTVNLWQTLVTTAQMRGEKYAMLRYYAVSALGRLGAGRGQVLSALARIAARESDLELRKEAVRSLKTLAVQDPAAEEALASSFAQAEDDELRVLILEALADMGSDRPAGLAGDFLSGSATLAMKRRVISALAQGPDEASATVVLDACRDKQVQEYAGAVLEGYPASFMPSLIERRMRTETDKGVLAVLASLDARFSQ
jgi:HEAT repeat protein